MEQQSLVVGVEQTRTVQPEWLTLHHGLQSVPAALTRCPSVKVEWKAQKKGALAPLAVQEASTTQIGRPILMATL